MTVNVESVLVGDLRTGDEFRPPFGRSKYATVASIVKTDETCGGMFLMPRVGEKAVGRSFHYYLITTTDGKTLKESENSVKYRKVKEEATQ